MAMMKKLVDLSEGTMVQRLVCKKVLMMGSRKVSSMDLTLVQTLVPQKVLMKEKRTGLKKALVRVMVWMKERRRWMVVMK